jgi:hypothetical protein
VLEVVADASINRQATGERPVILHEARIFGSREISAGISERLSVLIGLTAQKCIEGRKNIYRSKTVICLNVFMYPIQASSKAEQVVTPRQRRHIS